MTVQTTAVDMLLDELPPSLLPSTPRTHFPVRLPLTFPTALHSLNILALLHILIHHLSDTSYLPYFALTSAPTTPLDLAIRGLMGLYLTSAEEWNVHNQLSTAFFGAGGMDEVKVVEFFVIEVMREHQHESMPVRVGERWAEGVQVAQGLVGLFRELGEKVTGRCLGEMLKAQLERAFSRDGDIETRARDWCTQAVNSLPLLAEPAPVPEYALPSVPVRLLQDLAVRQAEDGDVNLDLLPQPVKLANLSVLPLPIGPLLYTGIIDPATCNSPELDTMAGEWKRSECDLYSLAETSRGPVRAPTVVKFSINAWQRMQIDRYKACFTILEQSRATRGGGGAMQSAVDVARVFAALDMAMRRIGFGLDIAPI